MRLVVVHFQPLGVRFGELRASSLWPVCTRVLSEPVYFYIDCKPRLLSIMKTRLDNLLIFKKLSYIKHNNKIRDVNRINWILQCIRHMIVASNKKLIKQFWNPWNNFKQGNPKHLKRSIFYTPYSLNQSPTGGWSQVINVY